MTINTQIRTIVEEWRSQIPGLQFVETEENQGMYDSAEDEANDALADMLFDHANQIEALVSANGKSFYEIHFTGEGFRTLGVYRLFFKRALVDAIARREAYDAEVRDWYENGEGRPADWQVEYDDNGDQRSYNAGGSGYQFPHCIHGTSLWTDYDNICGGCEDGQSAIEEAMGYARDSFLRTIDRWEWIHSAPGDLNHDTRNELLTWATSLFPKKA